MEVLHQPAPWEKYHPSSNIIGMTELKVTHQFFYLGYIIISDAKINKKIKNKLTKASRAFSMLCKCMLYNKHLKENHYLCQPLIWLRVVDPLLSPPMTSQAVPQVLPQYNLQHLIVTSSPILKSLKSEDRQHWGHATEFPSVAGDFSSMASMLVIFNFFPACNTFYEVQRYYTLILEFIHLPKKTNLPSV